MSTALFYTNIFNPSNFIVYVEKVEFNIEFKHFQPCQFLLVSSKKLHISFSWFKVTIDARVKFLSYLIDSGYASVTINFFLEKIFACFFSFNYL